VTRSRESERESERLDQGRASERASGLPAPPAADRGAGAQLRVGQAQAPEAKGGGGGEVGVYSLRAMRLRRGSLTLQLAQEEELHRQREESLHSNAMHSLSGSSGALCYHPQHVPYSHILVPTPDAGVLSSNLSLTLFFFPGNTRWCLLWTINYISLLRLEQETQAHARPPPPCLWSLHLPFTRKSSFWLNKSHWIGMSSS